jgi:hypothetical protein
VLVHHAIGRTRGVSRSPNFLIPGCTRGFS